MLPGDPSKRRLNETGVVDAKASQMFPRPLVAATPIQPWCS